MTEHLFRLKKDSKTVGYLQISEEVDTLSTNDPMAVYIKKVDGDWRTYEFDCGRHYKVIFDTAHPFVTKDKNGKDVFAGDKVKAGNWYFEVIWQKYGFGLKGVKSGWWRQFHEFEDIELIKEKEDETA